MELVQRAIRLMVWTALGLIPAAGLVGGLRVSVGVAGGIAWILVNMWALSRLLQPLTSGVPRRAMAHLGWWVLKLPVLYGAAVILLVSPWSSAVGFVIGFSMWFLVVWLCALRGVRAS